MQTNPTLLADTTIGPQPSSKAALVFGVTRVIARLVRLGAFGQLIPAGRSAFNWCGAAVEHPVGRIRQT